MSSRDPPDFRNAGLSRGVVAPEARRRICCRLHQGDEMKRFFTLLASAAACASAWQFSLGAQAPGSSPEIDALKRLTFRSIGPANQAGRVSVITGVPGDPFTFYVAGANGGVWKTVNGGT